jgi:ketosteroid isomerase-like protein
MTDNRQIATRYMELLCAGQFAEAFDLLAPDVSYQLIGKTPISGTMRGRDTVKAALVPALASFQQPPQLKLKRVIVDGDWAVGLASGKGIGPSGLAYDQPFYAMVLRIADGLIQSVEEYADMVEVETVLFGKKLVGA